ncbi:MAG: hypothetical protein GY869_32330, partial [Planctomycetes bacterium]|nr:hypothetical protein [Planctomycetota bacterium]
DINSVTIKYSIDNGTTWKVIPKTITNSHSYNWDVPGTVSDRCLVRVTAAGPDMDPKPSDMSDAVFSIVLSSSTPGITVTAPNGGEQLIVGSAVNITWNGVNSRENVQIEYSIDGGQGWTTITGAVDNNGDYEWIVPGTPSTICLVRISETGGRPSDISDDVFSIVQPSPGEIAVTFPNGGESLTGGSSQQILWTPSGGINNVTIEYSTDTGTTWKSIVQTTANDGTFDWTVPGTVSDECLVRITANDGGSDPIPSDISDQVFSIVLSTSTPAITVTAPNGGEQLIVGSTTNITWTAVNSREDVKIEYSLDGGYGWTTITGAVDNNGDYEWLVPGTPSETCLVRVGETGGQPLDISDAVFSIVQPPTGDITVTAPNGGEYWNVGSLHEITWTGSGDINNVFIEYSTDTGTTWKSIVQTTANDGSFDWTVPNTVSDECLVRVIAI